ncbi:hypothetical protein HAX54_005996 [Datura stramonium]|uniref:Uncharacterized protein n=1 Tax=Datura stramonium TaxID=4076 RepID=A0ABS8RHS8_DATST|nr:hypothetical protein [Datura stramonium]
MPIWKFHGDGRLKGALKRCFWICYMLPDLHRRCTLDFLFITEKLRATGAWFGKIPTGFLKYLKGHGCIEHAILRRKVKSGWHEGDMEFEVSIFDSSQREREYGAEEKAHTPEETWKKFEFKDAMEEIKPNIMSLHKAFPDLEAAKDMLRSPHLILHQTPLDFKVFDACSQTICTGKWLLKQKEMYDNDKR